MSEAVSICQWMSDCVSECQKKSVDVRRCHYMPVDFSIYQWMSDYVSECQYTPELTSSSGEVPDAYGHEGPVDTGQPGHEGAHGGGRGGGEQGGGRGRGRGVVHGSGGRTDRVRAGVPLLRQEGLREGRIYTGE